jgi:TetR/AcrR family transcriptional regulator, mexJK operon transcriptional repressor
MSQKPGKRELNKARKREEIIDVASCAFLEQGYGAVTMNGIAETLGGSKATLWAYFCNKDDLFVAVVEQQVEEFGREICEVLGRRTFSIEALRRFCIRFVELLLTERSVRVFRLVISEGERFPIVRETFYSRGPKLLQQHVSDFYATRFARKDAERLCRVTVSALLGYRSDAFVRPDRPCPEDTAAFVDDLLSLLDLPEMVPVAEHMPTSEGCT